MKMIFVGVILTLSATAVFAQSADEGGPSSDQAIVTQTPDDQQQIDAINCLREIDMADFYDKETKLRKYPLDNKNLSFCKKTVLEMMDLKKMPEDQEVAVFTTCGLKLPHSEACYSFVGVGHRQYLLQLSGGGFWHRAKLVPEHISTGIALYSNQKNMEKAKILSLKAAITEFKAEPSPYIFK